MTTYLSVALVVWNFGCCEKLFQVQWTVAKCDENSVKAKPMKAVMQNIADSYRNCKLNFSSKCQLTRPAHEYYRLPVVAFCRP